MSKDHVCQCDTDTWDYGPPPPCARYQGNGSTYCSTCEHDEACHVEPPREEGKDA